MNSFIELITPFVNGTNPTMQNMELNNFANELKKFRTEILKFTPKEISEKLNIAYSTYSAYERGIRTPKVETLIKLLRLYYNNNNDDISQKPLPLIQMQELDIKSNNLVTNLSAIGFKFIFNKSTKQITLKNLNNELYTFENENDFIKFLTPIYQYSKMKSDLMLESLITNGLNKLNLPTLTISKEGD